MKRKHFLLSSRDKNILTEEGSEKKVTSTMKIPATLPLPIRKWLLPNKIIVIGLGTKLHLVEVMSLLGPPPFYFLELRFISNTVTVVICVFAET